jgi:hypothetical protein
VQRSEHERIAHYATTGAIGTAKAMRSWGMRRTLPVSFSHSWPSFG